MTAKTAIGSPVSLYARVPEKHGAPGGQVVPTVTAKATLDDDDDDIDDQAFVSQVPEWYISMAPDLNCADDPSSPELLARYRRYQSDLKANREAQRERDRIADRMNRNR